MEFGEFLLLEFWSLLILPFAKIFFGGTPMFWWNSSHGHADKISTRLAHRHRENLKAEHALKGERTALPPPPSRAPTRGSAPRANVFGVCPLESAHFVRVVRAKARARAMARAEASAWWRQRMLRRAPTIL